jgi:FkbM family methyltransferase
MALGESDAAVVTDAHRLALDLLEQGDLAQAIATLHAGLSAAVDAEALNDLAVMAVRAGDADEARDLLRALLRLHPGFADGVQNLAALGPSVAAPGPPVAAPHAAGVASGAATTAVREVPVPADERRARFLQTVATGFATHLADNVDFLFDPWGRELPDPATSGERIAEQLAILDRADTFWRCLGDEASRALFLRFLAYRALGPAHVRLQLDPADYRRAVVGLTAHALTAPWAVPLAGMPFEWQMHQYDLARLGLPITVIGPPLPLASTMVFSQYAYRSAAAGAHPRPGDVALDVGGCWGDTALWLAHLVGDAGRVHTFEPTPGNRRLLARNLELNPALAPRITVHEHALAAIPGETVHLPDVIGAGATMQEEESHDHARPTVAVPTHSIDALLAGGEIPRVDFLKIDVEGADLGVLQGATETIRTHRPRLAVACYHKPDDLVTIPDLVASTGVPYRWYLQCSTMTDVDTVAFGVPVD